MCQDLTSPEGRCLMSESVSRPDRTRVEDCSNVLCCTVSGLIQNVALYCVSGLIHRVTLYGLKACRDLIILVLKTVVSCCATECQDLIQNVALFCFIVCQDLTSPEGNPLLSESVSRPHRTRVEDCSIVLCCTVSGLIQNVALYYFIVSGLIHRVTLYSLKVCHDLIILVLKTVVSCCVTECQVSFRM